MILILSAATAVMFVLLLCEKREKSAWRDNCMKLYELEMERCRTALLNSEIKLIEMQLEDDE